MTHNARVQVFLSVDFNTRAHRADKISSAKFAEKKNQKQASQNQEETENRRLALYPYCVPFASYLTWNARHNVCVEYTEAQSLKRSLA